MPRLKSLEISQASPKSQQLMAELESKKMLLNIFRGMANSPVVLDAYLKFSGALREGRLDAKIRAAIAITVAQSNNCAYCLAAHHVLGKSAGLHDSAMRDARLGKSSDPKTNIAIVLARQIIASRGSVSEFDVAAARAAGLDDGEIAEVVANVVLNCFTNYFNNVNQTEVDFPKVALNLG